MTKEHESMNQRNDDHSWWEVDGIYCIVWFFFPCIFNANYVKLVTCPIFHYFPLFIFHGLFIGLALIILYFNNKIIDFDHEFLLLLFWTVPYGKISIIENMKFNVSTPSEFRTWNAMHRWKLSGCMQTNSFFIWWHFFHKLLLIINNLCSILSIFDSISKLPIHPKFGVCRCRSQFINFTVLIIFGKKLVYYYFLKVNYYEMVNMYEMASCLTIVEKRGTVTITV